MVLRYFTGIFTYEQWTLSRHIRLESATVKMSVVMTLQCSTQFYLGHFVLKASYLHEKWRKYHWSFQQFSQLLVVITFHLCAIYFLSSDNVKSWNFAEILKVGRWWTKIHSIFWKIFSAKKKTTFFISNILPALFLFGAQIW